MKKITLMCCAAMIAAASFAQTTGNHLATMMKQSAEQSARPLAGMQRPGLRKNGQQDMRHAPNTHRALRAPGAPTVTEGIIDQPEGKLYEHEVMSIQGLYYSWSYGWSSLATDAADVSIVEGTDGNIYIKGLQTVLYGDDFFWLKAEPKGNDLYTIKLQPASVYYDYRDNEHLYYVARIEYYEDEDGYDGYAVADDPDITVWYKDGVLKTIDEMNPATGEVAQYCIGTVYWFEATEEDIEDGYDSGWYWNDEFYTNVVTAPLTETYNCPPEDAAQEELIMKYRNANTYYSKKIQAVFNGNDVYLRLYTDAPGWVKGTIEDGQVRVENGQYAGIDGYYGGHTWIHTATVEVQLVEDEDDPDNSYYTDHGTIIDGMTFGYDPETRTLTTTQAIYYDGAKDRIYYAAHYNEPYIYKFVEVPAVPANPTITGFWDYDDYYGSAELDFKMPTTDKDGNYIDQQKLSYLVYVDDELFEAEADEYEMDESMTEFPYGFRSTYGDIGATYFCVFFQPAENMGLQAIYRGGGEEHRSDIVMYDINTGEKYTIIDDHQTGISAATADRQSTNATFDLSGRRVNSSAKGIVIERRQQADGTLKTIKTIRTTPNS